MYGYGFWQRLKTLAQAGKPIVAIYPNLDTSIVTVTYSNGPDNEYTFAQVATWLTANANYGVLTEQDVYDIFDAILRRHVKEDGSPPPEGGWLTNEMPGRGGRR
jgi:uncharacterized protein YPO0396